MISFSNRLRVCFLVIVAIVVMFSVSTGTDPWSVFNTYSRNNISSTVLDNGTEKLYFRSSFDFGFNVSSEACDYVEFDLLGELPDAELANFSCSLFDGEEHEIESLIQTSGTVLRIVPKSGKLSNGSYCLRVLNNVGSDTQIPFVLAKSYDTVNSFMRDGVKENLSLSGRSVSQITSLIKVLFAALFCVLLVLFILLSNDTGLRSYILFAICLGLLFIVVQPFPASDLEASGVIQSGRLSLGNLSLENASQYWLPSNIVSDMTFLSDPRTVLSKDFASFNSPTMAGFSLPDLLLSAVSLLVGVFHLSYFWHIAAVRLVWFVLSSIISTFAIGISVRRKPLFFFLSTIPGVLLLTTTISSSAILYSMGLFYLSCCCNALDYYTDKKEQITLPQLVVMLIFLCFIGTWNVLVMFVLFSFVFVIPEASFRCGKKTLFMWLFTAVMLLIVGFHVYSVTVNASRLEPVFNGMISRLSDVINSPTLLITSIIPYVVSVLSYSFTGMVSGSVSITVSMCVLAVAVSMFVIGKTTLSYWKEKNRNPDEMIDAELAEHELKACRSTRVISAFTAVLTAVYLLACSLSSDLFKGGIWVVFAVLVAMISMRRKNDRSTLRMPILCAVSLNIALVFFGLFIRI